MRLLVWASPAIWLTAMLVYRVVWRKPLTTKVTLLWLVPLVTAGGVYIAVLSGLVFGALFVAFGSVITVYAYSMTTSEWDWQRQWSFLLVVVLVVFLTGWYVNRLW